MKALAFLLLAVTLPVSAQQRREALTLRLQLTPTGDRALNAVTVRVYNTTDRTINLWLPKGLACAPAPGAMSLQWSFQATERAALSAQAVQTTCGDPAEVLDYGAILDRIGKQKHTWIPLEPGGYTEIHDTIAMGGIAATAGKYEVRAVYTAPTLSALAKRELKAGAVETPKGQYRSAPVTFSVTE